MKILFIAGRETSYPRNDVVIRALERFSEVDVIGKDLKVRSITIRSILVFICSISKIISKEFDVIYIGFYGYLLLALVRLVSRNKILLDAFLSNFDTLVNDRKVFTPGSIVANGIFHVEKFLLRLPDFVLVDTREQVDFFINSFNIPAEKIDFIPVGCNQNTFHPQDKTKTANETIVLHYSSYLPLHGTDTILKAANLLKPHPIKFILDGEGQEYLEALRLANEYVLKNVEFTSSRQGVLTDKIANADVCLGNFGISAKSNRKSVV